MKIERDWDALYLAWLLVLPDTPYRQWSPEMLKLALLEGPRCAADSPFETTLKPLGLDHRDFLQLQAAARRAANWKQPNENPD